MSLQRFKLSRSGAEIGRLLKSPNTIQEMENKSRANRPAVEAIGKDIAGLVGSLSDDEKKLIGRWVKEILAPLGWKPDRKGRVAAGHFFHAEQFIVRQCRLRVHQAAQHVSPQHKLF